MAARTGVLILNYNGAADAVACAESLRALLCVPPRVVVCDNGSSDNSWNALGSWAGQWPRSVLPDETCGALGAREGGEYHASSFTLTLLRSARNLGFAGGCNVGLRYLLACPEIDRVWLLNNDTVVHQASLDFLVCALDAPASGLPRGVACGPVLYHDASGSSRTVVQAYGGGRYYPLLGSSFLNGNGREYSPEEASAAAKRRLDFPLGASMLVSRAFLESVGLLDERFFLYFEEIDWMLRARGRFVLAYTPHALIWHREGAACGASLRRGEKSEFADFHFQRSRLLCVRKHFPFVFPLTLATLAVSAARRVMRGQWRRLPMLWRCAVEACRAL